MTAAVLDRGGFGGGGGRGGGSFGGSRGGSSGTRVGTGTRSVPKAPTSTRVYNAPHTVINNRVTNVRVYNGRSYPYHYGGWGYGYYGPHVYIEHWYGYPMYYCNPVNLSGWDFLWWTLGVVALLALIGWLVARFAD